MRVVIVGAGEVGSTIAAGLAPDHEVVVVDVDADRVEALQYDLDVLGVEGDGADLDTLETVDIGSTDMLIASTDDDETNIVTCGTVKTVAPDCFTIARVRSTMFLDTWDRSEGALGVDFMVGTNRLAAESLGRIVGLPAALDVEAFAEGSVLMAEFEVTEESPVAGETVAEADRWESLTFAALLRNGDMLIPTGDTEILAGDAVVAIGSPASVRSFAQALTREDEQTRDVVVLGGSAIGFHAAELLEDHGFRTTLVERDPERARDLAEQLPDTTVLEHDATDREFLEREHVGEADAVIATLDTDEKTLLAALLARRIGADRAITVVENGDYVGLFEEVGVDVALNPREVTAQEITRFTRERHTENVAIIESDLAEVIEVEVGSDSVLVDRPIRESVDDLPDGVVLGAIVRDGAFVIPRGDTVIEAGDHVVLFMEAALVEDVVDLI